jgi:hypothetical protein
VVTVPAEAAALTCARGLVIADSFSRKPAAMIADSADGAVAEGRLYGLQTCGGCTNVPSAG